MVSSNRSILVWGFILAVLAAAGSSAIPLPAGWSSAYGYGINDFGQVAGWGYNANGISQAFIGTPAGSTAIPLPAGLSGNAEGYGINNFGQVASWANDPNGITQAFVGAPAGSTLVPLPAGWLAAVAYGYR